MRGFHRGFAFTQTEWKQLRADKIYANHLAECSVKDVGIYVEILPNTVAAMKALAHMFHNPMLKLLSNEMWTLAYDWMQDNKNTSFEIDIMTKELPLHIAAKLKAPEYIIEKLIELNPGALHTLDSQDRSHVFRPLVHSLQTPGRD